MNYLGTYTLFRKEVWRFLKIFNQTLVAPVVNSLLFLAIFQLALGNRVNYIGEIPFEIFMASGLIMMTIVQQAFANGSANFVMGKVIGHIIDYLMPPISAGEMILALSLAAVVRGFLVAILAGISIYIFVPISIDNIGIVLLFILLSSFFMALLGLLTGIFAEGFDQMAAVTSYIVTPLAFLSGTFYSTKNLPEFWQEVIVYNPFFYMIDGFRYGMTGHADGDITTGLAVLFVGNIALWAVLHAMISRGYRLKT